MADSVTRSLMGVLAVAGIGLTALCDKPKPQPTPSPTATVEATPAPTPVPTATPYECPAVDPARLRLPCKPHSERGDGWTLWDCTLRQDGQDYMPEGHPEALACELKAMGGRANFVLVGATGSLTLKLRDTNAFQFLLSGSGAGKVICPAEGFDPCRGQMVSR